MTQHNVNKTIIITSSVNISPGEVQQIFTGISFNNEDNNPYDPTVLHNIIKLICIHCFD